MNCQEAAKQIKSQRGYHIECMAETTPGSWLKNWQEKRIEALDLAAKSLEVMPEYEKLRERDRAKLPDFEGDGYDPDGNMVYDTWICPNCEAKYEVDYDHYDFCPKCGQRIDWSEGEEE